ncbi:MAG: hypothetical protein ACYST2_06195 [Planctomycetota bacterium]
MVEKQIVNRLGNKYCISFFTLASPCKSINKAPYDLGIEETDGLPPAPGVTALCVSESPNINRVGYWFYYPVFKFLEHRHCIYFAYDPTKELYKQPSNRMPYH